MEAKVYCAVCGAENDIGKETCCYNCDNPLCLQSRAINPRNSASDTLSRFFAGVYFVIFIVSLIGYLLSITDTASASNAAELMFMIPILFHLTWVKWVDEISGVYKGKVRFRFLRSLVLYSVISLTIFEIVSSKSHPNKDRVTLVLLMVFSLVLFYSYFFGKKNTGFNYFKFS